MACVCALLMASTARAERWPIRRYTMADGLAHDRLKRVVQDSHGFLWFCTALGLSRFDGYRFSTTSDAEGRALQSVNDMLEDGDGRYWIATNGAGVCRFTAASSSCRFYAVGKSHLSSRVNVLRKDARGRIWAGTDEGLFRLDAETSPRGFEAVDLRPGAEPGVAALELSGDDLWVGSTAGLLRMGPGGRVGWLPLPAGPEGERVRALSTDSEGHLWIAHASGLIVLKPSPAGAELGAVIVRDRGAAERIALPVEEGQAYRFQGSPGMPLKNVFALFRSSRGVLWVGTRGGGLSRFDGHRFRTLPVPPTLTGLSVLALTEDRDGNLWAGTLASGALKIPAHGFSTYDEADGLASDTIISIFEDEEGALVVITAGGFLSRYDGNRFLSWRPNMAEGFAATAGLADQVMLRDAGGGWWVRSPRGLFRFAVSRLEETARALPRIYTVRDGLPSNSIDRIYQDAGGRLWVSCTSPFGTRLATWDRATGRFREAPLPARSPPWAGAATFREDRAGALWIGFNQGGLLRYRDGHFDALAEEMTSLVRNLHLDGAGRLWVASERGGLGRIDDPTASHPTMVRYGNGQGLGDDAFSLTEDLGGHVYVGTLRGVARLDPATGSVKHYTVADGLAQNEQRVSFRDRHGRLWFGTSSGLSSLVPEPDAPSRAPKVRISGLRVAGAARPLSALGETAISGLTLPAGQGQLQIEFVSLTLAAGEVLHYQYRLQGADRDWSAPSFERTVNYASLPAGSYRFLVRAVNAEGLASTEPASLSFTVLAPIWRRGWFLAVAAALLGMAVHLAYRLRLARLLELERIRTRIASDLHDDIGSNLSQIAILGEVAQRHLDGHSGQAAEPLALIGSLSRETVDAMGDIVWAIDPHKDRLGNLAHRMRRLANEMLGARGIAVGFSGDGGAEQIALGADVRRQVFLIFKEALHNAARHSACTRVEVGLRLDGGTLVLEVTDDGRGFDLERAGEGHGLGSLQKRAHGLGGTLEVASGVGTRLVLRVPARGASRWRSGPRRSLA